MTSVTEPKAHEFFASRSGVCVYVKVQGHAVRVQFATMDALGVAENASAGAEQAVIAARAALHRHRDELAPLFDKVARRTT